MRRSRRRSKRRWCSTTTSKRGRSRSRRKQESSRCAAPCDRWRNTIARCRSRARRQASPTSSMKCESRQRRPESASCTAGSASTPPTNAMGVGLVVGAETAPEIPLLWQDDELLHDRERRNKQDDRPPRRQEQSTRNREEGQTHIHRISCVVVGAGQNERFRRANGDDACFRATKSADAGERESHPSDEAQDTTDRAEETCGEWQRPATIEQDADENCQRVPQWRGETNAKGIGSCHTHPHISQPALVGRDPGGGKRGFFKQINARPLRSRHKPTPPRTEQ